MCTDCVHSCVLYTINDKEDIDIKINRKDMNIPKYIHKNHAISFIDRRYKVARKYNSCYSFEGV